MNRVIVLGMMALVYYLSDGSIGALPTSNMIFGNDGSIKELPTSNMIFGRSLLCIDLSRDQIPDIFLQP